MRGSARCRAHRDAELGPRRAGPPLGNLNALVHGRHSHPLPPPDFQALVRDLVVSPDDLPLHVARAAHSIHARTGDPFLTLVALRRLLSQLAAHVAARLLRSELDALLRSLTPGARARVLLSVRIYARHASPEQLILLLARIKKWKKQLMEPGSHG